MRAAGQFAKEFMTKRVAPRLPPDSISGGYRHFIPDRCQEKRAQCPSSTSLDASRASPRECVNQACVNRRRALPTLSCRRNSSAVPIFSAFFAASYLGAKKGRRPDNRLARPREANTYKRAGSLRVTGAFIHSPPATILIIGRLSGITSLRATYEGVILI